MPRANKNPWQCKAGVTDDPTLKRRCRAKAIDESGFCETHRYLCKAIHMPEGKRIGLYGRKFFSDEELAEVLGNGDELKGHLLAEIAIARMIVRRALKYVEEVEAADELPEESEEVTWPNGTKEKAVRTHLKRKMPDLWSVVDRALRTVGRLTEQQARIHEVDALRDEVEHLREALGE